MKKILISIVIVAIALTSCFALMACDADSQNVVIKTDMDYSLVLKDYLAYPDADNVASMNSVERNVTDIFNDDSLTDAQKVAEMMDRATYNEIECVDVAYFMNKVGTTNLGSNSGNLVYQRLRRQSDTVKDDTTLKLPVNHNFNSVAVNFVSGADIRYVRDTNKYYRMDTDMDNMIYNEETGLIDIADSAWERESRGNWDKDDKAIDSRHYEDIRKSVINWSAEGIVDAKDITIELKEDANGNKYYYLKFSIDIAVANADSKTIERLENDNGGSGMKFEYCTFEAEIWECGLPKMYKTSESWSGTIVMYSGSAQSDTEVVFSYSDADMDYSHTESIYQLVLKNL